MTGDDLWALPAPTPATERHLAAVGQILAAMSLKAAYLARGKRLLFLHIDFRSGPTDLQMVEPAVRELSSGEVSC